MLMEEPESISGIAWNILRLVVGFVIVCPIIVLGGLAWIVGIGCDRAFHFIARIMRIYPYDT